MWQGNGRASETRCVEQREIYSLGGSLTPPSNYHAEMRKLGGTGRSLKNSGHSLVRLDHSQRRPRCSQQDFDHSLTRLFLPGFPWESPTALSNHVACLQTSFVCCRFLGRQTSAALGSLVTPTILLQPAAALGTSALSSFLSQILTRVYIQITGLWLSHNKGRGLISWE